MFLKSFKVNIKNQTIIQVLCKYKASDKIYTLIYTLLLIFIIIIGDALTSQKAFHSFIDHLQNLT